jgi:UDP:flavonoid glycosyltransferase YjiC (YdhE family)
VFPTLQDLVGRVVVEALTLGVPVVLSPMTGGRHGGARRCQRADRGPARPARAGQSAGALCRAATRQALRDGARRSGATLAPDAVAALILRAVALVRERRGTPAGSAA